MGEHIFSLIIPCYNEEKTIAEVVKKSSPFVDEIIVVNDASTDKTKEILEQIADVHIVNNYKNLGQEPSIEKGIKISQGDIIITMDADMEHNPMDIPRLKNYLLTKNFDLVIGKRKEIPREGEKKLNHIFEKKYGITDVMNSFRIFKKTIYTNIGFYHKNGYYGLDFLMDALKKFRVGQIEINKGEKRIDNSRIGINEKIELKLEQIISYVKKEFER